MRTLLLASLTISALQNPADACGPYVVEPTVFQLTSGFALLNQAPDEYAPAWRRLHPNSYDHTQIADTTPLATPMTITLVGPSGTKVVSSKERALIKSGFSRTKATVALAIDRSNDESFYVALAGNHPNAAWIGLGDQVRGSQADVDWVTAQGVTPYRGYGGPSVYIRKLQNTAYETITVSTKSGSVTFIRSAGQQVLRFDGAIVGGLSLRGHTFVIKSDRAGVMTSMWI